MFFFFFNDTATTEIYTLSLYDALPISFLTCSDAGVASADSPDWSLSSKSGDGSWIFTHDGSSAIDGHRSESTRLNSSHANISYAVFCLKKKTNTTVYSTTSTTLYTTYP